ncbi:MAG: M12 family metallo-peptidase [Planctomycetota bacterium]
MLSIVFGLVAATAGAEPRDVVAQALAVAGYSVQDIGLGAERGQLRARVALQGTTYELLLSPHSVRADDFALLVAGAGGACTRVDPARPLTYHGQVTRGGAAAGRVAGSLHTGQLQALVRLDDGSMYGIEPLRAFDASASSRDYVVYDDRDLMPSEWRCGSDVLEPAVDDGAGGGGAGTGLKMCDVAFDADFEFYNKNQGSVEATMYDIEYVMAGLELIYERDTGITYEVTTILVRTAEPDPYTSTDPGTLLNQFRSDWQNNHGAIRRDIAHLMTGKNLDGSVIGIAYVGVVCGSYGYGLSQSRFSGNYNYRVGLTAHEIGHNWNASHCDGISPCYIMCSSIGGCSGDVTKFDPVSISAITAHRDSRNCLDTLADPVALPFSETFPSTTLSKNNWSYGNGVAINTDASNEPSAPYSVNLDAAGAGADQDDDLRTNFVLLGGVPTARLSYAVEHRGVESGKQLVIEAWTTDLKWQELNRITSDGSTQNDFVAYTHLLPAAAYHDEFRVRFRPEVNATNDEWYVDDVSVVEDDCPAPQHYGTATPGTAGIVPVISYSGRALVGSSDYKIVGTNLYGGQQGFLFTGFSRQTVLTDIGVWLNVLPPWIVISLPIAGAPLPGAGTLEVPAPIPNDPALDGVHFMNFILGGDPGGPGGYAGTDGLDTTICG